MNHQHIESAVFYSFCCDGILVHNVFNHFPAYLVDMLACRKIFLTGAVGKAAGGFIAADTGKACVFSTMGQLDVSQCAMALDGHGRVG